MGVKDDLTKRYMSRPDVFADAFNYLIYDGQPIIKPENLHELDTAAIVAPYDEGNGDIQTSTQKSRDVLKQWVGMYDENATYLLLGVENQSHVHYAMPARNLIYDAINYDNQIRNMVGKRRRRKTDQRTTSAKDRAGEYLSGFRKSDRLIPVITLVIYFGSKEWDGPLTLREMYSIQDEHILKFAVDYRLNIISPAGMADGEFEKLQTDLREVMSYIKYAGNGEKLTEVVTGNKRFRRINRDTAIMINTLTGSKIKIHQREETVDMCVAIQQIEQRGLQQGRAEGRVEGIHNLIEVMRRLNLSRDVILYQVKLQYNLTDEQAEAYMQDCDE